MLYKTGQQLEKFIDILSGVNSNEAFGKERDYASAMFSAIDDALRILHLAELLYIPNPFLETPDLTPGQMSRRTYTAQVKT